MLPPLADVLSPSYVAGRVVLSGDTGATVRPMTGSGATTGLQDALEQERFLDDALPATTRYERRRAGGSWSSVGGSGR